MIQKIAVTGAGTMGSGIAQVAAHSGFETVLFDVNKAVLEKARTAIQNSLQSLVEKQKITAAQKEQTFQRIKFIDTLQDCIADIVIEAIVEKISAKVDLFNQLAAINNEATIFASNTSSLSITNIQASIIHPQRVAGMHFFNPAPLMKLVEVVKGRHTNDATILVITDLCSKMEKIAVICKDAPGFIVNRVARQYYLEAMKLVEHGVADLETVDAVMEASGFKMGPFRLMDLIGMDINLAVSTSIYEAFNKEERFKPSSIQIEKVSSGELGRKTGKGFYQYK